MTLRTRLALLTTALLASVLAASGVVLERVAARDVERSLEDRVRTRARSPLPARGDRTAAAPTGDPFAALGETRPPPPPPEGEEPPPPDDGMGAPPPPRGSGSSPASAPGGGPDPTRRVLQPESDGAFVAVFHFQVPASDRSGEAILRAQASTGGPRVSEREARAALQPIQRGAFERAGADGTSYLVVQELAPLLPQDRGPPGGGPPGWQPGDPRRPPMGQQRRVVSVAFLEAGPAREQHRAFVLRIAAIGIGALLLGALLAWALAGRMLRPVADAARAAEAIERPAQRLPMPGSADELGRLVGVLNGMLGRLEASSNRERLFLATASHELRRPLTALLGELELAAAPGRALGDLRSSLGLAREDARAMGRLVEDLLHHARAQAGTFRLVEGEAWLPELVTDAADRSRRSVPHAFALEVEDVPEVLLRVDPDVLRQALENLIVNAAVHGGEGVHVKVHGERTADALLLHVEDDGPGFPPEECATIFEPFGRGDRARAVPGFGLGLAIALDAAHAHDGTLTAASPSPGIPQARPGARFTLRLPLARVVPKAHGTRPPSGH